MEAICELEDFHASDVTRGTVSEFDMKIFSNELLLLSGPSGSGKSLVLRAVLGLVPDAEGTIRLFGEDVQGADHDALMRLRMRCGYACRQAPPLANLGVRDNVVMPLMMRDIPHDEAEKIAMSALESLGLASKANHRLHLLPRNEIFLLSLARALALPVELMVLVDPLHELSRSQRARVLALIEKQREAGVAMLISTAQPQLYENLELRAAQLEGMVSMPPMAASAPA